MTQSLVEDVDRPFHFEDSVRQNSFLAESKLILNEPQDDEITDIPAVLGFGKRHFWEAVQDHHNSPRSSREDQTKSVGKSKSSKSNKDSSKKSNYVSLQQSSDKSFNPLLSPISDSHSLN